VVRAEDTTAETAGCSTESIVQCREGVECRQKDRADGRQVRTDPPQLQLQPIAVHGHSALLSALTLLTIIS
jgi:hypothetical protein